MATRQFALAIMEVLARSCLDRLVGDRHLNFDFWGELVAHIFELLVARPDDPFAVHREVLSAHLAAEEVKPDVADDLVEFPAAAEDVDQMLLDGLPWNARVQRLLNEGVPLTIVFVAREAIDRNVEEGCRHLWGGLVAVGHGPPTRGWWQGWTIGTTWNSAMVAEGPPRLAGLAGRGLAPVARHFRGQRRPWRCTGPGMGLAAV